LEKKKKKKKDRVLLFSNAVIAFCEFSSVSIMVNLISENRSKQWWSQALLWDGIVDLFSLEIIHICL